MQDLLNANILFLHVVVLLIYLMCVLRVIVHIILRFFPYDHSMFKYNHLFFFSLIYVSRTMNYITCSLSPNVFNMDLQSVWLAMSFYSLPSSPSIFLIFFKRRILIFLLFLLFVLTLHFPQPRDWFWGRGQPQQVSRDVTRLLLFTHGFQKKKKKD